MVKEINVYKNTDHLAQEVASEIASWIYDTLKDQHFCTLALSGGNTPIKLFEILSKEYSESIPWNSVHIFWADERCVPPTSTESNYGNAQKHLLNHIEIPPGNIHRIKGELAPEKEVDRYSLEISKNTNTRNQIPVFDLVLLGIGEDGHTASIFPNQIELLNSFKISNIAIHPVTKQQRITLSGKVINNAKKIIFMASGSHKAKVLATILGEKEGCENLPAYYISPTNGNIQWHMDKEAGELL